ncbi:DUF4272 domain-containing protein [Mucilaginibacter sp. Bleaf8]|uniref:DUF4272 domain-containing protein n=1 Tax=Mucilaginibacter sp. Bleaf8 TaxID=2834430 RepID=UPI001BD181DD|nr:DUF4272 domain-containing protein [Mucilaginibacter sp. Bleaf8]MBS7566963.1 DUF4272 domain-containing protein [Mucilaginibacter sp. Bleaf8]
MKLWGTLLLLALAACNNTSKKQDMVATGVTVPAENIKATADQQTRRNKSEAYCKAHGVPIYSNPNSMFSDPENQVTIRSKDEVIDRLLALCYIGLKSEGLSKESMAQLDQQYHMSGKLSPAERAYITAQNPTEQQKVDANWRYESMHVMLWALGLVDDLAYPDKLCDVANDNRIIRDLGEQGLHQKARLRSKQEIMDQADLALRLHWAVVDARVNKEDTPAHLESGVVYERHYALNWLINYGGQDWDDVGTDT